MELMWSLNELQIIFQFSFLSFLTIPSSSDPGLFTNSSWDYAGNQYDIISKAPPLLEVSHLQAPIPSPPLGPMNGCLLPSLTLEVVGVLKFFPVASRASLCPHGQPLCFKCIVALKLCVLQTSSSQDFLGAHRFLPTDTATYQQNTLLLCLLWPRDVDDQSSPSPDSTKGLISYQERLASLGTLFFFLDIAQILRHINPIFSYISYLILQLY